MLMIIIIFISLYNVIFLIFYRTQLIKMSFWHEGQEGEDIDVVKVSLSLYLILQSVSGYEWIRICGTN